MEVFPIILLFILINLVNGQNVVPEIVSNTTFQCISGDENSFCTFTGIQLYVVDLDYKLTANTQNIVEKVQFHESQIPVLTNAVCSGFPQVWDLRLWRLGIEIIQDGAFTNCIDIKILNLYQNKLIQLPVGIFSTQTKLEHVVLQENQLECISTRIFNSSRNTLQILDARDNNLQVFKIEHFINFPVLKELKLENNKLLDLDVDNLKENFKEIKEVWLKGNKIICSSAEVIMNELKGKDLGGFTVEECTQDGKNPTGVTSKLSPTKTQQGHGQDQAAIVGLISALTSMKNLMTSILVFTIFTFVLVVILTAGAFFTVKKLGTALSRLGSKP